MLSRADAVYFKDYSELSMNLAFVIYRYFPHGGLQQDLEKIVCECIARGHKVTVFAGEWQGAEIPYADIEIISPRGLGRCEKIAAFERKTFQQLAQGKFDAVTGFIPMRGLDVNFAGNDSFPANRRNGLSGHASFRRIITSSRNWNRKSSLPPRKRKSSI